MCLSSKEQILKEGGVTIQFSKKLGTLFVVSGRAIANCVYRYLDLIRCRTPDCWNPVDVARRGTTWSGKLFIQKLNYKKKGRVSQNIDVHMNTFEEWEVRPPYREPMVGRT